MLHNNFISILIIITIVCVLYKLYYIDINSASDLLFYYIILLEIMAFTFDHLYEAFGDICI